MTNYCTACMSPSVLRDMVTYVCLLSYNSDSNKYTHTVKNAAWKVMKPRQPVLV